MSSRRMSEQYEPVYLWACLNPSVSLYTCVINLPFHTILPSLLSFLHTIVCAVQSGNPVPAAHFAQDLDEVQAHILIKRWVKDTGQDDLLLENTVPNGQEVTFGLDVLLQVCCWLRSCMHAKCCAVKNSSLQETGLLGRQEDELPFSYMV